MRPVSGKFLPIRLRAAMGAEFRAGEHHAKTGGAGDGCEPGIAVLASRGFRGSRRTAVGAVESLRCHWRRIFRVVGGFASSDLIESDYRNPRKLFFPDFGFA
jgi:hypothetical protein